MCSGSEAGSYLRLIDFVYHSTLCLRAIKKKKKKKKKAGAERELAELAKPDQTVTALHRQSWGVAQIRPGV